MKRFQRLRLFLSMLLLLGAAAATVLLASPYAPAALPAPEDMETIWAIEDARTESETPLVTALEANGMPLAYDAQSNTFYCTLGLGRGEAWPDIRLSAPGAAGVKLMFVDDYTFDSCADAIRDGYAYEVLAYTEEEFSYLSLVFTALPQLCLFTDGQEITTEDARIRVTMMAGGEEPLTAAASLHLRGASTLLFEKKSYKLEFLRERSGMAKKTTMNAPGFGPADDIALLPCLNDETKMRDRLGWDLWNAVTEDDEPFGARKTAYVEVFKDNAYHGLYLMVEPVDMKEELKLAGDGHVMTDSVYRTAALNFSRDREYYRHPHRDNAGYELYHAPQGAQSFEQKFAALIPYIELTKIEDDAAFAARTLEIIDVDSMLRYMLLMQGGAIADNFFNNMYIWAQAGPHGGVTYRFGPWDLDISWGMEKHEIGEEFERWLYFPVADRMLNLDVGGIRQRAYDLWQQLRGSIFNEEALERRLEEYVLLLGESGALMRDAERWGNGMTYPDGYEFITFASVRWPLMDEAMELLIRTDGPVNFLSQSNYAQKAGEIFPIQVEEEW